jgi:hypothetical protein
MVRRQRQPSLPSRIAAEAPQERSTLRPVKALGRNRTDVARQPALGRTKTGGSCHDHQMTLRYRHP